MPGYAQALALTLAIEVPAYAIGLRHGLRVPTGRALVAGLLVNLISHPVAFLVVMPRVLPAWGFPPALAVVEVGVWGVEWGLLWAWRRRDADLIAVTALVANALSLSLGWALLR